MRQRLLQIQNRLLHFAYEPFTMVPGDIYVDDLEYVLSLLKKADPSLAVFTTNRTHDSEPPRP